MDLQEIAALCGLDDFQCRLVRLYCSGCPGERDIVQWFSGLDLDALWPEESCMAAAVAAAVGYKGVPEALVPRLRGITKYIHTLNAGMTAGLYALGSQWNRHGISVMLVGQTAISLACPAPPQRQLWQMQAGIWEADFSRAVALAEAAGFSVESAPWGATARRGKTQCVHIRKEPERKKAPSLVLGSGSFVLPDSAQLLIHLADTLLQILSIEGSGRKLLPWMMDLHCAAASIRNWEEAALACKQRGAFYRVQFALEIYSSLSETALYQRLPAFSGGESRTARLAGLLHKLRECGGRGSKGKRLWLRLQLKKDGSRKKAAYALPAALLQAAVGKIRTAGCSPVRQNEASADNP